LENIDTIFDKELICVVMIDNSEIMVSISCLAYNQEKYIRQCLDGFVMQRTNFRFEAIVHDDASTDDTASIIREYEEKYPDIIKPIYEVENQYSKGGGVIEDMMASHMRGKYIAICEGDDYWIDPLKLQKQYDYMESHPECSLCCHNAFRENAEKGRRIGKLRIYDDSRNASRLHVFRDGGFLPTASLFYRNALFSEDYHSFPVNSAAGDIRIQCYAALVGDVYYLNEAMSVCRINNQSVTHGAKADVNVAIKRQEIFINWYQEVDKYTQYHYHQEIDHSIAFCEARINRLKKKYFKLWNPRYWSYLGYLAPTTRVGLWAGMLGLSFVPSLGLKIKKRLLK